MVATSLIPLVTNFPEICAFIIGFSFTVRTEKSTKIVRKQVTEQGRSKHTESGHARKWVWLFQEVGVAMQGSGCD